MIKTLYKSKIDNIGIDKILPPLIREELECKINNYLTFPLLGITEPQIVRFKLYDSELILYRASNKTPCYTWIYSLKQGFTLRIIKGYMHIPNLPPPDKLITADCSVVITNCKDISLLRELRPLKRDRLNTVVIRITNSNVYQTPFGELYLPTSLLASPTHKAFTLKQYRQVSVQTSPLPMKAAYSVISAGLRAMEEDPEILGFIEINSNNIKLYYMKGVNHDN